MSKKSRRERAKRILRRRAAIIGGCIAVAVVAIVWVGWLIVVGRSSRDSQVHTPTAQDQQKLETQKAQTKQDGALRDSAEQALASGNVAQANTVYQQAIDNENDTTRKIQLYIQQSGVLYDAGQSSDAIATAQKAAALSTDQFLVADWLSRVYEDQRDYTNAANYYSLAGQWASSTTNQTGLTKSYYDDQATRMHGLTNGAPE